VSGPTNVFALLLGWWAGLGATPAPQPDAVPAELRQARAEAARATYQGLERRIRQEPEKVTPEDLYRWSCRLRDAERAGGDARAALTAHRDRMQRVEELVKALVRVGQASPYEVEAARYYRVEAEIGLLQAPKK
jgi:hypothetical protein